MSREEASDKLLAELKNDELCFNSTTLEELSQALQDGSINIIRLHGERGSGKTTLVGLVRDKVKSLKMLDAVLFVSMIKIPDPWKIQGRIAEELNHIFGRKKELKSTLGSRQILVILDDVPATFDPWKCMDTSNRDPQFKFLLTAHSDQLLDEREIPPCQKMIRMGRLSLDVTWRLFRKHSGIEDDKSELSNVANEIGFNDEWFPGSAIEMGSFLKDRPHKEWKGILDGLRLQASAKYDIFLSFRGADKSTRDFKSALCNELMNKGLTRIFENDAELRDVNKQAIEDSILSIVVLSMNYIKSAKCLDELVHIIRCMNTKNHLVWPIYYKMESLMILHHQTYDYAAKQLRSNINNDHPKKIKKWMAALREVSQLPYKYTGRGGVDRGFIQDNAENIKNVEIFLCKQIKPLKWSNGDREFELFFANPLLMALEDNGLCFNSETLKELSEALQDDSIHTIGLYGQKGSGKTTLVEAVRDKVKSFDVVLFATVSQDPNIKSIQDQIARSLDLEIDKENKLKRALKIESALANIKRILVILDDVPAKFEPEEIGFPCSDERCKFLLTTRRKQDCNLMISQEVTDCQKMISMRHLSKEDAWKLLQKHSGIDEKAKESLSNPLKVAKEIAFNYEWFPGTITEVGSSLKGKPCKEWQGLLNSLKHSSARFQIFLSFRGEDTRSQFTSTLYAELRKNEFKTFMDDRLRNGDLITAELENAIKDSRLSIVVLSEHYGDSGWCLDELVHILKCNKEPVNQLVWSVFYMVEPTDVRHQTGDFGKAMAKLEGEKDPQKIEVWKEALFNVCQFTGRAYKQGMSQPEFIQKIIDSAYEHKNYLYLPSMDME